MLNNDESRKKNVCACAPEGNGFRVSLQGMAGHRVKESRAMTIERHESSFLPLRIFSHKLSKMRWVTSRDTELYDHRYHAGGKLQRLWLQLHTLPQSCETI